MPDVKVMETATDRVRAEQEARANELRLRRYFENASEILYSLDSGGVCTFVSPAWTLKLGHALGDAAELDRAAADPDLADLHALEEIRQGVAVGVAAARQHHGAVRRHPGAAVRHLDERHLLPAHREQRRLEGDGHPAPGARGVEGVVEEVEENLLYLGDVHAGPHPPRRRDLLDPRPVAPRLPLDEDHLIEHPVEVGDLPRVLPRPAGGQEVADDPVEPVGLLQDYVRHGGAPPGERARFPEHLDGAADRRERCADLVRHAGEDRPGGGEPLRPAHPFLHPEYLRQVPEEYKEAERTPPPVLSLINI